MQNIKLLDCTLRDGGYVNNWKFEEKNISLIVQKLIQSGIEIIECGYLSILDAGSPDVARYSSIKDMNRAYAATKSKNQTYAVMINFGEYPAELLEDADEDSPIIRVAFHKKDLDKAFEYFYILKEKGYRFFVQPMGALNYTDEEYVQLIKRTNELNPEAFYIVDSFGVMEIKDFKRLLFLSDNNLGADIQLGYHSHNNLQQAYGNSKYMAEQHLDHDLIIDASVFGMGRGAGNLNIELFSEYLNQNFHKNYNIEPFLEVFDECLKPIFIKNFWGYSLPFYLSSIHNCHPNYASYFSEKNTLSVKSMHELLNMITEEDKSSFSDGKAAMYYQKYQENWVDDKDSLDAIKNSVAERKILVLAPGYSLKKNISEIKEFIDSEKPVVFGVNKTSADYNYDYLFVANEKRLTDILPENVNLLIMTSNLNRINKSGICVNYSSYLCNNDKISDNPTLMLINMLVSIGVREIFIAGFDGFSANPDENYFSTAMSLGSKLATKMTKNSIIKEYVCKLKEQIDLEFITDSLYL